MTTSPPANRIRVLVTWTIKPGQTDVFLGHAKALAEEMRKSEPGCRSCEFFLGPDGKTMRIYEEYADAAAVTAHLASPAVANFMPKFMACSDGPLVELLGDTPPAITGAYTGFGATFLRPKVGFTR